MLRKGIFIDIFTFIFYNWNWEVQSEFCVRSRHKIYFDGGGEIQTICIGKVFLEFNKLQNTIRGFPSIHISSQYPGRFSQHKNKYLVSGLAKKDETSEKIVRISFSHFIFLTFFVTYRWNFTVVHAKSCKIIKILNLRQKH